MDDVRGITVRQPWAWAIAYGGKTVENRSRGSHFRGRLLIHTGYGWSERGAADERVLRAWRRRYRNPVATHLLPFGMVIAVAELVDVHPDADCCRPWGESSYVEAGGRVRRAVHLVLEDVVPLRVSVPCLGALGLWRPPAGIVAKVTP